MALMPGPDAKRLGYPVPIDEGGSCLATWSLYELCRTLRKDMRTENMQENLRALNLVKTTVYLRI